MLRSIACLLALACLSGGAVQAQYFDWYPHDPGDATSWTDANNWVKATGYDLYTYPIYPGNASYTTTYPNQVSQSQTAYIRDQASVTIRPAETITMSQIFVGDHQYVDSGGSFLPRSESSLTIDGGTLNITNALCAGGAYQGRIVQKGDAKITIANDLRLCYPLDPTSLPSVAGGTYLMQDGILSAGPTRMGVRGATSLFEQTGGTATFASCFLGTQDGNIGGHGIYDLMDGIASPSFFIVGSTGGTTPGTGELNLLGGTLQFFGNSSETAGISINNGSVTLGKGFHCDVENRTGTAYFQQFAAGDMFVELRNLAEFGYMSVSGNVTLDGTFSAIVAEGASWIIGDTFEVLRSRNSTISATPAFLDSYNLLADRYFNISLDGDGLLLTAIKEPGGTIPPQPHPGDANNNGVIDVGDLGILAFNWGNTNASWAQANFTTPDTVVDVGDLGVLAFNWGWAGTPAGAANLPEPASLALLGLGGLAILRRRR